MSIQQHFSQKHEYWLRTQIIIHRTIHSLIVLPLWSLLSLLTDLTDHWLAQWFHINIKLITRSCEESDIPDLRYHPEDHDYYGQIYNSLYYYEQIYNSLYIAPPFTNKYRLKCANENPPC